MNKQVFFKHSFHNFLLFNRCKICYENYEKLPWDHKCNRSQLSTYEGYLPNTRVQFSTKGISLKRFYNLLRIFFINLIFTVSSHTASGSIHERIINWMKLQSLDDMGKKHAFEKLDSSIQ